MLTNELARYLVPRVDPLVLAKAMGPVFTQLQSLENIEILKKMMAKNIALAYLAFCE